MATTTPSRSAGAEALLDARRRLTLLVTLLALAYGGASAAAGQDETSLKIAGIKGPVTAGLTPFVGKLNGFEFYDVTKAPLEDPNVCAADEREELFESDLRATGLDFAASYLPKGTILVSAGGQKCPGRRAADTRRTTSWPTAKCSR